MSLLSALLSPAPTRDRAPLPSTGRAGRNLPAAIAVAAVLVALVLGSLMFNKVYFVALAAVAVCAALWELAAAFARKGIRLPLAPLWLGTIGIAITAWRVGAEAAFVAYAATAGACVLWCFMDEAEADTGTFVEAGAPDMPRTDVHDAVRRSRSASAAASVLAATYLPFLAGFAVLLAAQPQGVEKVILLIALPVANDTGGWLAGITMGRHPMARSVSPKKTWEGFIGSLVAAVGTGAGCMHLMDGPLWAGGALGACIVVVSTIGDLGESLLKRDLGLKDMGRLLPGHGGIMDRLDSILVAAPVVYVFSLLVH
ncbi:phosphatidate cytidylyltransferase [Actinomyces slackii]|uniref:Phosphatidate cytidylyltransferase n=1 Tax=Actinomyces slackii TaxID=52774 RepID=A0A448KF80_9ACTO|nr:Phosphatidate cytidylyltransferase [Actinomyces slackii]